MADLKKEGAADSQVVSVKMADSKKDQGADFETAVSATNFGLFNIVLFLVAIPSNLAAQFEAAALSFVYPAAQCDLNLTTEDKGLVNAVIYVGMIGSCLLWGPLTDIFGRRNIMMISHLLDSLFCLFAAFSPNLIVLIIAKFMGGFIINGPSMAITPFWTEFHGTRNRSIIPLLTGLLFNAAIIVLPLIAWNVLPLEINFELWGGFEIHSWNIFLIICAIPSLITGICVIFLPETPKYLMSQGKNEEAMTVFQKMFKLNTRKPKDEYPIKNLIDDRQIYHKNYSLQEAWKQISPLFSLKYLTKLLLVCSLMTCLMMCVFSLRLWLPEIFQIVNDYQFENNATTSFCDILDKIYTVGEEEEGCSINFNNSSVYINSMIVGATTVAGYACASLCINKIGKKRILIILGIISAVSEAAIYFAPTPSWAIVLICVHVMCSSVCIDTVIAVIVDLFPTYLRASALSLSLMCGRLGSVLGNLIFPILVQSGCAAPFFTFASVITLCTILSTFLPNTHLKALD